MKPRGDLMPGADLIWLSDQPQTIPGTIWNMYGLGRRGDRAGAPLKNAKRESPAPEREETPSKGQP